MADNQAPDYMAQYDYAANGYNPDGRLIDALKSTWKPTDPVKLQTMDQMLAGDNSGKSFNPTEHGYEWNADYGRFMNPNGSTILVNPDGSVVNATPAYKDYEFNGQYFNPAGENVSWNPEKNQSAYKLGGVEVPIGRENMKGIAAYTDQSNNPQMQIDRSGQAIFTEPEGLRYTGNFMDDTGAPILAGLVLGGTTALASGAFGAGTTLAGEAAAAGGANAASAGLDLGTNFSGSAYGNGANAASAGLDLGTNFRSVHKLTKILTQGGLKNGSLEQFSLEEEIVKTGKISNVLKKGDEILVQIFKEPIANRIKYFVFILNP